MTVNICSVSDFTDGLADLSQYMFLSKRYLCYTSWELNLRTAEVAHFNGGPPVVFQQF